MMESSEPEVVEVAVSVDDASRDRIPLVVAGLQQAGLQVVSVMEAIGAVSGWIERSKVPELSLVEGVAGVEVSRDYELPHPDSDIQ